MSKSPLNAVIMFGWLNVATVCIVALVLVAQPQWLPRQGEGLTFNLLLQLAVASALIFAASQKREGNLLGHKTFPATLVAYVLFVFMVLRWLAGY